MYNEARQLQKLLRDMYCMQHLAHKRYLRTNDPDDLSPPIEILIAGKRSKFFLGGPQSQALEAFIDSIAAENGYTVDRFQQTVSS